MNLLILKKNIGLLLFFVFNNLVNIYSQNLDLLSKKCPSNWAFFIGEVHHVKEIRDNLYKLIAENTSNKKNTVLFIELPRTYNYRFQKYLRSGKETDLHKMGQLFLIDEKGATSAREDFENLLSNIYKLNQSSKNAKIALEFIDKEINDSVTLTLLDEQFKISSKITSVKTIFDSAFYYRKTVFDKGYYIKRLINYCMINQYQLITNYGQEAFDAILVSFKGLSMSTLFGSFFGKKSLRDSIMYAHYLEASKKYENYNFIIQFGTAHIYKGVYEMKGIKHKPNFYQYVLEAQISSSLCSANVVYFCKKNTSEMSLVSEAEATFLKQFKGGEMIENKNYPELKTLSTHFDYTIILEEATLMMPTGNTK
jgi:hypothetical protein